MVAAAAFVHSDLTDKHLNEALFLVWFCWLVVLAHSLWSWTGDSLNESCIHR